MACLNQLETDKVTVFKHGDIPMDMLIHVIMPIIVGFSYLLQNGMACLNHVNDFLKEILHFTSRHQCPLKTYLPTVSKMVLHI
jgi:hypothetical protein